MKQIVKVIVGVSISIMSFSLFAQASPACYGSGVNSCSSVTTQTACAKSYIVGSTISCPAGMACNKTTGHCVETLGQATPASKCVIPGIQCVWNNGVCSNGGNQCQ